MYRNWLLQHLGCRIFSLDRKSILRCKGPRWGHPSRLRCVWWWSPSTNKSGTIHTANLFPTYIFMHYFWDTWTIDWLFFRHLLKIFLPFRFLLIQIFTRLQFFWKQSLIRSSWAFRLNLILSNCATSHLRTCLKSSHRCQLLLLLFFSVDLRQGVPLYTGDPFPNRKWTKVFSPWRNSMCKPVSMKQTWTRSWSAFWNKRSKKQSLRCWFLVGHMDNFSLVDLCTRRVVSHLVIFPAYIVAQLKNLECHFYFLPPCLPADLYVQAELAKQILLLHYINLWIRFPYHLWPSNRNPTFWNILPRCSSSSWRNSWTTDRATLTPGIYLIFLKPFSSLFLTYKSLLWFLWRTTSRSTTPLERVSWSLQPLPRPKKRITSWRVPFNFCIALAHLLTDLRALLSFNGYGSTISIPCKASLWNFQKYKHFMIFLKPGTYDYICLCYTVKKDAVNTQPSWLGVCVYLLKRSKTCTTIGCGISCWSTPFIHLFIYLHLEFFYQACISTWNHSTNCRCSIFDSRGALGPFLGKPSATKLCLGMVEAIWPDQSNCVPAQHCDLHGDQQMFGSFWFSCLASCCFELTKEHLLSWLWHLMPQFLLKCVYLCMFMCVCVCVCDRVCSICLFFRWLFCFSIQCTSFLVLAIYLFNA